MPLVSDPTCPLLTHETGDIDLTCQFTSVDKHITFEDERQGSHGRPHEHTVGHRLDLDFSSWKQGTIAPEAPSAPRSARLDQW